MTSKAETRRDRWTQIWHVLGSDRLLFIWLGIVGAAILIALWFPQAPGSVYFLEGGLASWFATVRSQLGSPADSLLALGFLTVERAGWLRVALAGVGLTLLLQTLDTIQNLRAPQLSAHPRVIERVRFKGEPAQALATAESHLKALINGRLRVHRRQSDGRHILIGNRPLGPGGRLLATAGGIIMLCAWSWTQAAGWEVRGITLTETQSTTLAPIDQTLKLEQLKATWGNSDAASARATLGLWEEDRLASGAVDLGKSWRWQGVSYHLTGIGPAVQVRGQDANERPLDLQTAAHRPPADEIILILSGQDSLRSFAAPAEGVVVQVETEAGDEAQVRLRVFKGRAGELVEDRSISHETSIALNESQLTMAVIPFAEIRASYTPGRPLLVAGGLLALAGLAITMRFRPCKIQIVASAVNGQSVLELGASRPGNASIIVSLAEELDSHSRGDDETK